MKITQGHIVIAAIVCATLTTCVYTLTQYNERVTKIEAEAAVKMSEQHEKADIEQTEERSQFWQKLVPWGSDEEEADSTPVVE